jgi:hypothetical protein
MPPVPSLTPVYMSTQTTTTDQATTTWSGLDIGVPHPKRVVVVGYFSGATNASTVTLNGLEPVALENNNGGTRYTNTYVFPVPSGTTGELIASTSGSSRKAASIWVYYPNRPFAISSGQDSATGSNPISASLTVQAGGAVFYTAECSAVLSTFTTTWGGTESVVEDVDAQHEATSTYTMGHINILTSSVNTLTATPVDAAAKQLSAIVLGPAYG